MADDVTLQVGVEADATGAVRDMRAAATAASALADSFREIASMASSAAKAMNKVEQGVSGATKSSKAAATSIRAQAQAVQELNKLESARANVTKGSAAAGYERVRLEADAARKSVEALNLVQKPSGKMYNQQDKRWANKAEVEAYAKALGEVARAEETLSKIRARTGATMTPARPVGFAAYEAKQAAASAAELARANGVAAGSTNDLRDSLFTARFALNDISISTGIAGAALLAFNAAAVNAAATYETAMASIERTTSATSSQMAMIREQFVDLAQSVPAGFDNIAQIGELAGQLNIPTERLASFTEVVAQFTSSTDVAVQQSAEAFGRLDALLPDVQGNYEALGSSILNVGVNSVATESAIISTTTQIAAAGAQARFSADEVIGLAASFASLGIAPEAARGSTIRIFSELRTAVLEGGDALETFAALSNMSADQFKSAWLSGDSSQVFIDFLKGLQSEGANAETTLRELGITGVRDINALLRLSQNVDVVSSSFGYAADGFSEATQLATAFGITSETLNSRIQILGQSFQAFMAELGASGTGPLKVFVDALIGVLDIMTTVSKSPAAQWIAIFGGLFTLLAGGVLILTSVVARLGALNVAVQTTRAELLLLEGQAAKTGTAMTGLGGAALKAGLWISQLGNILKVALIGVGVTAALTLIIAGITAIGEASKSAGQKAEEAWGDLSGLTSALAKDTETMGDNLGSALGTVEGKMTTTKSKTADWVSELENATGAQTSLATETDLTTQSVESFTYAIGENTAAWLANKLANDDAVKNFAKFNTEMAAKGGPTADFQGFIAAAVSNDTEKAKEILDQYQKDLQAYYYGMSQNTQDATDKANAGATKLNDVLLLTTGALDQAATAGQVNAAVNEALGVSAAQSAGELEGMGDAADTAADRLAALSDSVAQAFGFDNAIAAMAQDVYTLLQGIADGGVVFDSLSSNGIANMENLQGAIVTTIAAGEAMGISAVESVGALFLELQRRGVDTANLLASIANIPEIGNAGATQIAAMLDGKGSITEGTKNLTKGFQGIQVAAPAAAGGIGKVGNAAKEATKEIRTLVDWANDLGSVFDRAFSIRYDSVAAADAIATEWHNINEEMREAKANIREIRADMLGLKSSIADNEYFLKVAVDYGDDLRAAEIRAKIAEETAELAEKNKDLKDEQAKLNKTTKGNTQTARDNRTEITGMIGNYQKLIEAYAAAGHSQAEVEEYARRLKKQFTDQAVQAGFSRAEIKRYALSFNDMTLAIQKVPRKVTVDASVEPAIQALREFEARAKNSGVNAGRNVASGMKSGIQKGLGGFRLPLLNPSDPYGNGFRYARDWRKGFKAAINVDGGIQFIDSRGGRQGNIKAYRTGGYTGGGNVNDMAGIVHGKEFVVNAENTSRLGIPFLNALNSGMTPSAAPSNSGIMVVELSARDRALLANAGNVSLSIDGKVIADATNSANFVSTKRGSN